MNNAIHSPEAEIYAAITECCGLSTEACHPAASVYELGIDSLGLAALISHFEVHLSIDFDDDTILKIMSAQTIGQIAEILKIEKECQASGNNVATGGSDPAADEDRTANISSNASGQLREGLFAAPTHRPTALEGIVQKALAYAASSAPERVATDQRLRDLGIDSVGCAAVGVVLESETGVRLSMEELAELFERGSVGDLIKRLESTDTSATLALPELQRAT